MKKKPTFISVKFHSIFVAATFTMMVEYILGLSDKIIVGQFLPEAALPALTLIEPMSLLVAFVACVLSAGTGMQVSAALGKGDQKTAEKQFGQALILAAGIGIAITAVYLAFSSQIVEAIAGGRPESKYVAEYFRFSRLLPVPMLLSAVLYPVVLYRGGETYCNVSALLAVAGNIGLSLALVPVMGMEGISFATVIGSWACLVPLFLFLKTDKGHMKFRHHLSLTDIRSMGVYCVADSAIYFYMAVFQACMNAFLLGRFGSSAIVVFTGVVNLTGLFASMSEGIGEFLLTMINMYRGEKNVIGEKNTMQMTLKASVTEALIILAFMMVFAGVMPSLLGVTDPNVRSDFVMAVRIYAVCAPFFYVLNSYVWYYLYIGKVRASLVLSLFMNLLFPLLFSMLGGLLWGMNGVWIGMAAAYPLLTVCAWLLVRRQKGADDLCMFLDRERMACQRCWDVEMTESGIGYLLDSAEAVMLEKGISRSRINRVLLAIEETQMEYILRNKHAARQHIECTLFLEEKITLVLRNTGANHNAAVSDDTTGDEWQMRQRILAGMQNKRYIFVNGSNRLIFEF